MQRLQQQFHALGSDIYITLIGDSRFPFEATFQALHHEITSFERRFSRFLPESELTAFNSNAGNDTSVSATFIELLHACMQIAEATDGLYNPFILPALQKAGYKGSWPSPQNLAGASDFSDRQVVPYTELQISTHSACIPANSALDFGGIGKGYLLDKLCDDLRPRQLHGYWISLGGDIACRGYDLDNQPWAVYVQHASIPDRMIGTLTNTGGSPLFIATSGVTKRRGENSQGSWHHIINPQTGLPADTAVLTATVTATSGVKADVYAKTIVIAGKQQARKLKDVGEIRSFILQYEDKEPTIKL